ncbi:putative chaperone DNAJ protein [Trypanosoma cruzi]|uniref:Putative chaperone DNAJ protein n=1 Tax=Trypanosoma cruzi TaxID=5693 RepID=A0A2V2VHQ7_TRYCR|nr:putative chaperone DNAJ protein [Trypanosoma cruzi]
MVVSVHKHDRVRWAWHVLGIDTNPSYDDIRAAYCRLAVMTHPDRCTDPSAKEKFQMLHAAYETALKNNAEAKEKKRRTKSGEVSDFDWRAEVARVRAAYSSTFKCPRASDASRTPWQNANPNPSCSVPQRTNKRRCADQKPQSGAHMVEVKRATAARGGASGSSSAQEEEERRLQAIRVRRRGYLSPSLNLMRRIVTREASRRHAIVRLEQKELRCIYLISLEERIRRAIEDWADAFWVDMSEQWTELIFFTTCSHNRSV